MRIPASFLSDSSLMRAPVPRQTAARMPETMLADSLARGMTQTPHEARSFSTLPGPDQVLPLLAEIATPPCDFAPAAPRAPLALYGAGKLGRLARDFLNSV